MTRRVLFLVPGIHTPGGGTKVFYEFIALMRQAGISAAPVYNAAHYKYIYSDYDDESYYVPGLSFWPKGGWKTELKYRHRWKVRPPFTTKTPHPKLDLRDDDVIVHPEFVFDLTTAQFPNNMNVLMAQDAMGLLRAHARQMASGLPIVPLDAVFTTSQASAEASRYMGHTDIGVVPLTVEAQPIEELKAPKKKQIAFMLRKRPDDIELMQALLRVNPALNAYRLVPIDKVSNDELRSILRDSLFFLSFSKQEGFGLPPAEAMAAGCLTIGFTGVGGEEYFQPDIGFPIKDGDMVAFAQTVAAIAQEYDADPTRLDAFRLNAAHIIRERYSQNATRSALLAYWADKL